MLQMVFSFSLSPLQLWYHRSFSQISEIRHNPEYSPTHHTALMPAPSALRREKTGWLWNHPIRTAVLKISQQPFHRLP